MGRGRVARSAIFPSVRDRSRISICKGRHKLQVHDGRTDAGGRRCSGKRRRVGGREKFQCRNAWEVEEGGGGGGMGEFLRVTSETKEVKWKRVERFPPQSAPVTPLPSFLPPSPTPSTSLPPYPPSLFFVLCLEAAAASDTVQG